jgi:cyclopropane fatty-acyl-phospholipid synthase-like methyltransferase
MDKPFSPPAERNREPLLEVLRPRLSAHQRVLEIGSGTGQHAVHFAAALPHLQWQTSEQARQLPGLRLWLDEAALPNTPEPITLDVNEAWPESSFDAVFTANTLHIMSWAEVQRSFAMLPTVMQPGALLIVYGPFNIGGQFTSEGNAKFDASLRRDNPLRGLRDFEAVDQLASAAGLILREHLTMPANNRCLVWQRAAAD